MGITTQPKTKDFYTPLLKQGTAYNKYLEEYRDRIKEFNNKKPPDPLSKEYANYAESCFYWEYIFSKWNQFIHRCIGDKSYDEYYKECEQELRSKRKSRYKSLKQDFKWKERSGAMKMALSKEEQEKFLTPAFISSLTTEQYIEFINLRLSGDVACHLSRFGVRDAATNLDHTGGNDTYLTQFRGMLENGKCLRDVAFRLSTKHDVLKKHIDMCYKDVPLGVLPKELTSGITAGGGMPCDKSTIHFSVNHVFTWMYGGERGYDIVNVFPMEILAKLYENNLACSVGTFHSVKDENTNDYQVFAPNGIPLDLGIVVIPGSLQVSPKTGSQYVIDEETGEIKLHKVALNIFEALERNREKLCELGKRYWSIKVKSPLDEECSVLESQIKELMHIPEKLKGQFRIGNIDRIDEDCVFEGVKNDDIGLLLKHTDQLYEKCSSGNSITSQEYWEQYFEAYPEYKPAHVLYTDDKFIYEKGSNPTKASTAGYHDLLLSKATDFKEFEQTNYYKVLMSVEKKKIMEVTKELFSS